MKKILTGFILSALTAILFIHCGSDDNIAPNTNAPLTAEDFSTEMKEYPDRGDVIGTVTVHSDGKKNLFYAIKNKTVTDAIAIDNATGELTVDNSGAFIYGKNTQIKAEYTVSDGMKMDTGIILISLIKYPIQERLDNGETPMEIYNSNPDLEVAIFGKIYKGGYIIEFRPGNNGSGAVVSGDLGTYSWGCEGTLISWTGGWMGQEEESNKNIMNECPESNIASKVCDNLTLNGYSDWQLPTEDGLDKVCYGVLVARFLTHLPEDQKYWSCSQVNKDEAKMFDFAVSAFPKTATKSSKLHVVAIREFDQ